MSFRISALFSIRITGIFLLFNCSIHCFSSSQLPSSQRSKAISVLFGKRNSGKSSLINALTGQDTALVSDIPGTTTDAVSKAMEIQHIGPCLFIDTPGFDDEGELGEMRITRTLKAIERTDM